MAANPNRPLNPPAPLQIPPRPRGHGGPAPPRLLAGPAPGPAGPPHPPTLHLPPEQLPKDGNLGRLLDPNWFKVVIMRCTAGAHEGSASVSLDRTQGTWPFLPNEFLKSAIIASSDLPIKHLILKHHRLSGLPENFSCQSTLLPHSLTTLDLSFNIFTTLPTVVCRLQQLKELFLNNNEIAHLPDELSNLGQLQTLHLQCNKLEALPVAVCSVKSLLRLNLDNNSISLIPSEVSQLVEIQELYLSWNQLECLPAFITQLSNLRELHLSNNVLRQLPETLEGLSSLQQLHLANNKLRFLPKSIVSLEKLSGLTLSGNSLKFPPLSACRNGVAELKAYMKEKLRSSSGVWRDTDEVSVSVNLYCNDTDEEEEEESGAETPFEDMDDDDDGDV